MREDRHDAGDQHDDHDEHHDDHDERVADRAPHRVAQLVLVGVVLREGAADVFHIAGLLADHEQLADIGGEDAGVPDHISLRELLLTIRHGFDQYINLRPVKLLEGAPCPLKDVPREDIDMIFIRENSEGEYSGSGAWLYKDQPNEVVIQNSVFSRKGCERVIRYAYELARKEGRSLTSVSKANALNYSMVFWDQIFEEVGREYPDVETRHLLVDAASMFMVRDPKRFGVVVTSNLFGDILTDLGAAISGGMGLAAGANLNPERRYPSMFEAIHGSAPDIAGQNIANPLASIWTAGQMLDFFGYEDWGTKIVDSIEQMLVSKKALTPDLGGSASTTECGDEMVRILTQ